MREPLALPRGSVRALLALVLTLAAVAGFLIQRITADQFMALATMALAFYFGTRASKA